MRVKVNGDGREQYVAGRDARRPGVCGGAGLLGGAEDVPGRAGGGGGALEVQELEGLRAGFPAGDGAAEGVKLGHNEDMVKSVEGVYRNGKVELIEPLDDAEGARVIVTLVRSPGPVDLAERGIRPSQAADLRHRLAAFAEDWDRPEMSVYDELPSR